jgi:hypothetical protein
MMRAQIIRLHVIAVALFVGFLSEPTLAQNTASPPSSQDVSIKPIGRIVSASGSVTIERVNPVFVLASVGNQPSQAKVGDPIYRGDVVATGGDGKVGITFTDGTAFDLSNNARMAMTEFVYDPNSNSNSSLLSLTKGTFTFVAGKIAKTGDMKVDTPVATMGIRGTTPRVEISDDGSVKFSTLIEDGKDKVQQKLGGGGATPGAGAIEERSKPNLEICRGC